MASREHSAREHHMRGGHALSLAQRSSSYNQRPQSEGTLRSLLVYLLLLHSTSVPLLQYITPAMDVAWSWPLLFGQPVANKPTTDSWIEISSQPSSSSLSSVNDEIITTGLRVQQEPHDRRRRRLRQGTPSHLNITSRAPSVGATSSQEEYDESESDEDRVMTSSTEGLRIPPSRARGVKSPALQSTASDDDEDEDDRTAINYPINTNTNTNTNDHCFTPQPNAFSRPSGHRPGTRSQPVPGSYFPSTGDDRPITSRHPSTRQSYPSNQTQHSPYNIISPNHNAAADHDAALRASLSTLISFAGAARGLAKKSQPPTSAPRQASTRMNPSALRMVPESALREGSESPARADLFNESTFKPTLRRASTSTTASADRSSIKAEAKRKAAASGRACSKDRRVTKKRKNSSTYGYADGEMFVTPTLLTWVMVAGVGVFISALSFSAGYAMGKEAGRFELNFAETGDMGSHARDGVGLRKLKLGSVARSVGVGA